MPLQRSDRLVGSALEATVGAQRLAVELERRGSRVIRLDEANPADFDFDAPSDVIREGIRQVSRAAGDIPELGLVGARSAVVDRYTARGVEGLVVERVYLGNGVSELAGLAMAALLNDGDEVLVPSPDYPLWTTAVTVCGGVPVPYQGNEADGWTPDLSELADRIGPRTRAIVLINPNSPTGAVYGRDALSAVVELAHRNDLVIFADEVFDEILYDGARHESVAALAPDVLCLTFSSLSKAYRLGGFRAGWLVLSGPHRAAQGYIEALEYLLELRLGPNELGQHAVEFVLRADPDTRQRIALPHGRLDEQRRRAWQGLTAIPGVTCVAPAGGFVMFAGLDPSLYPVADDRALVRDLLVEERVLVTAGSTLTWPRADHLAMTTLPRVEALEEAMTRLARFLAKLRGAGPIVRPRARARAGSGTAG